MWKSALEMLRHLAEVAKAMRLTSPLSFLTTLVVGVTLIGSPSATPLQAADAPAKPAAKSAPAPAKPADPKAKSAAAPPASLVKKPEPKDYSLTRAQQDRLQKYLPKAYPKLSRRDPFHVVAIGDEIMAMAAHNDDVGNMLKAWPAQFLNELSSQFLYTGGVRLIKPLPGKPAKELGPLGPAITLRCLPREGGLVTQAMQTLTTYGFESPPDLVIVSYGLNDAASAEDLGTYVHALQQIIETARAKGADVVLVAPILTAGNAGAASLGGTRPFAAVMREAAEAAGVLFADPANLKSLFKFDLKTLDAAALADDAVKQYRRFFTWNTEDFLHPVAELHRLVGRHIFDVAVGSEAASTVPWKLSGGTATFDKPGHFSLSAEIENTGKEPLTLFAAGLELARWKAAGSLPKMEIKPGEKQAITLSYDLTEAAGTPAFASHEPSLRVPV